LLAVTAATAVPQVRHAVYRAMAPAHHHRIGHPHKRSVERCAMRRRSDASSASADNFVHDLTSLDPAQPDTGKIGGGIEMTLSELAASPLGASSREGWNASSPIFPTGPGGGWIGAGPGQPGAPTNPAGPGSTEPTTGVVPEPASWAFMLMGFGAIGAAIRSGKRASSKGRKALAAGGAAGMAATLDLGAGAALATVKVGAFGLHAARATALKSIGVCVCSAAVLATTATTIPPLRHALYAATSPGAERAQQYEPCPPDVTGETRGAAF